MGRDGVDSNMKAVFKGLYSEDVAIFLITSGSTSFRVHLSYHEWDDPNKYEWSLSAYHSESLYFSQNYLTYILVLVEYLNSENFKISDREVKKVVSQVFRLNEEVLL